MYVKTHAIACVCARTHTLIFSRVCVCICERVCAHLCARECSKRRAGRLRGHSSAASVNAFWELPPVHLITDNVPVMLLRSLSPWAVESEKGLRV